MQANPSTTQNTPRVADAPADNWADRYAPESVRPYLRLARLDRPIGFWLLLLPCWWSVGLAEVALHQPYPNPWLLTLFALGALAMRAAGCATTTTSTAITTRAPRARRAALFPPAR